MIYEAFNENTEDLNNTEKLKSIFVENGYLYFKNLINKRKIEGVKRDINQVLKENRHIDGDINEDPKWSKNKKESGLQHQAGSEENYKIANLKSVKEILYTEEIIEVLERLAGGEIISWADNCDRVRIMLPGESVVKVAGQYASTVTPMHQDHFYLRLPGGKKATFYNVWVPLMDIDEDVGGIALTKNTHNKGFYKSLFHNGRHLGIPPNRKIFNEWVDSGAAVIDGDIEHDGDFKWLRSDYHTGDLLIFSPMMIHKGLLNTSDKIRLSLDVRYLKKNTQFMWRAEHRLEHSFKFFAKVRQNLKDLQISGSEADRIMFGPKGICIEGPNTEDIKDRIKKIVEAQNN